MIIKLSDGTFYEFTENEYLRLVSEILVHFNTENKLTVNFFNDTRVEAAKLLLSTVSQNPSMDKTMKDDYFKVAFELIEQYNYELMQKGQEPLKANDLK